MVELRGFEPLTFSLRTRRATNCATAPCAREREEEVTTGPGANPNRGDSRSGAGGLACGPRTPRRPGPTRERTPGPRGPAVLSVSSWPEELMPVSSMVRTVRRARALLTYVGSVIGSGSQSEPSSARAASISSRAIPAVSSSASWSRNSSALDANAAARALGRTGPKQWWPEPDRVRRPVVDRVEASVHPTTALLLADRETSDHQPADDEGTGNAGRPDRQVGEPGQCPDDDECEDEHTEHAATTLRGLAGSGTRVVGATHRVGLERRRLPGRVARVGGHVVGRAWGRGRDGLGDLRGSRLGLAGEDPHLVGVTLDQPVAGHLVVVLEGLGDQVDGPREGEHDEDDC